MRRSSERTEDFRKSVARMAQYRPFGAGEVHVEFARRSLVLAAAHENGGGFASLADAQTVSRVLWGLDLEIDELREVVKALVRDGKLKKDGAGYVLTKAAGEDLTRSVRKSAGVEAEAFAEWESGVVDPIPTLSSEQVGELRDDPNAWLQHLITRFGVEAALVLYPEDERARRFLDEVQELGFDLLPSRDESVEKVRPKALYAFIHRPTPAQRLYLANLMTTAYLHAVFTLDPRAHEVVQSITKGQRIYLDTNVVYAILNLSGPPAYLSVRRVLELSRQLGYEICVTPWTVAEMKGSVRRAREKLAGTTLPPRALAEIAAEFSGEETFITAYWRKYRETGVTAKDFLDLHEQIEALLETEKIVVIDEACVAVDRDEDGLAARIGLLETVPGGREKSGVSHPRQRAPALRSRRARPTRRPSVCRLGQRVGAHRPLALPAHRGLRADARRPARHALSAATRRCHPRYGDRDPRPYRHAGGGLDGGDRHANNA